MPTPIPLTWKVSGTLHLLPSLLCTPPPQLDSWGSHAHIHTLRLNCEAAEPGSWRLQRKSRLLGSAPGLKKSPGMYLLSSTVGWQEASCKETTLGETLTYNSPAPLYQVLNWGFLCLSPGISREGL